LRGPEVVAEAAAAFCLFCEGSLRSTFFRFFFRFGFGLATGLQRPEDRS
jgi:hypothetical protein